MTRPSDIQLVLSLAIAPGSTGYKVHNAGYKALGLDYLYLPRKYDGDIKVALDAVRALGIKGASLTMPYKVSALSHLDALSPDAEEVGAVNTVVNEGGRLIGYNTDAPAAQKLIEENLPWQGKPLVILGAGGMARAFAYAVRKLGADGFICAREKGKAKVLAERFRLKMLDWGEWDRLEGKIVCNATPIGMAGHKSDGVLPGKIVESSAGVFDAVANPGGTELLKLASVRGLPVVSGDMLSFEQACLQFKLYTGSEAPRDAMQKAIDS